MKRSPCGPLGGPQRPMALGKVLGVVLHTHFQHFKMDITQGHSINPQIYILFIQSKYIHKTLFFSTIIFVVTRKRLVASHQSTHTATRRRPRDLRVTSGRTTE